MPRLLFFLLLLAGAAPALAQPGPTARAQMNAQVAALCDGDTDCMDTVRQRLQAHCAQDRTCMRAAIQQATQKRDESDPTLSDLPEEVQDIVRALLALDQGRGASGGSPASGRTLPAAAAAQLEALPQRMQDRIRQRCGTDLTVSATPSRRPKTAVPRPNKTAVRPRQRPSLKHRQRPLAEAQARFQNAALYEAPRAARRPAPTLRPAPLAQPRRRFDRTCRSSPR